MTALPPGYMEYQRAIPPEGTPDRALELDRAIQDCKREARQSAGRDVELYASRIEITGHNTILYCGFVPVLLEGESPKAGLNPRNMNGAEQRVLGQIVHDDPSVGYKEKRFGQGVPVALPVDHPSIPIDGAVKSS